MTEAKAVREGQTFAGRSRLVTYANFVKLPHTVFALPFALVGVVLASRVRTPTLAQVGWVVLAFTSARFAAMGFNRIADRHIDAANPRTSMREIPAGVVRVRDAWLSVVVACFLFLLAAWRLGPLCLALAPVALGWVFFYSLTKRFTRWSHLALGLGLSIAPVGGYLAVTGRWSEPWWMLCALSLAVMTWSGGFDILYALQDVEFDRAQRLHSVPVAYGERGAFRVARLLHVGTVLLLALVGVGAQVGPLYWLGVLVAAGLLLYEHSLVRPGDLLKLDAAFFTMNGVISITFFLLALLDRVLFGGVMAFDIPILG
jgi:4-hydroxybenzoate polyprenyltransferase